MTALRLNSLGLLAICAVFGFAFADQLIFHDLPCPLCILQRAGFFAAGFGIALNLTFGLKPGHYGLAILGAILGGAIAVRQVLLHIVPGTGAYGDAFFGLHFYTWAFLVFLAMVVGSAVMLLFEEQFAGVKEHDPLTKNLAAFAVLAFGFFALANGVSTVAECGAGLCPDSPTDYLLLQKP
ncbi:disulfide bond formation protein B [Methyloligella sp. GL2]|nr:disulfide bond formation protein B [Methyloligella sp. GL2]